MIKRSILLAAPVILGAAPALLLGGCMGTENRGLESVHQPVVSRTDYALDVATSGGALAPGEARRIAGWMASMRLGYGDKVAIDDPASDAYAARDDIAGEVARYGILLSDETPVTVAAVTPGTIRIVVSRMRASVPGCPDWSRDESTEFDGNTSSNQGCAINSNLAAMVARPEDLVRGQSGDGTGSSNQASATKAIEAFRKATPTGGGGNTVKSEGVK